MRRLILTLLAAAAILAETVDAQGLTDLQQGARIRVHPLDGKKQVGVFMAAGPDSLRFSSGRSGGTVSTRALAEVGRVDVSEGRSAARGALRNGAIGFLLGGVAGALLGAATYTEEDDDGDFFGCIIICSRGQAAAAGGFTAGAAGLIIGGIVGIRNGSERWRTVFQR